MKQIILINFIYFIFIGCSNNQKEAAYNGNSTLVWSIDSLIYNKSSAKWLKLQASKIKILPDIVFQVTKLEKVEIENCYIENPVDFYGKLGRIKTLNELWLTQNKHLNVGSDICFLNNLKIIRLISDTIDNIPACIFHIQSLEELWISGIVSYNNSDYSHLKNIKILGICSNQMSEIPEFVYSLKNLEYLDLSDTQIAEIPKKIGELKNLKKLGLYNTPIESQERAEIKARKQGSIYSEIKMKCNDCAIISNIR